MNTCMKCGQPLYAKNLCKKHHKSQWIKNNRSKVNAANRKWQADHRDEHLARRRLISQRPSTKFSQLKAHAKVRRIPVIISLEEYTRLTSATCEYCRGPLPEVGYGLDRKDNCRGYSLEKFRTLLHPLQYHEGCPSDL